MADRLHQGQVAGTRWEPAQYLQYADHRLRPALELLSRIRLENPMLIYDLGCGTGQITRLIGDRWPDARVIGLDNSPQMLEQARTEDSRVEWTEADIRTWQPDQQPDLIYSNATLHWVEDHRELFPGLAAMLPPGGCLAVQMPLSWSLPSHRLMRETLADGGPGGEPLGPASLREAVGGDWVAPAEEYYGLLAPLAGTLDIWETEYLQVLEGPDPVLEWVKGTGLRPILNGLDDSTRAVFLQEYARRLRETYPLRQDGRTLYPFRRLFIVATV